MTTSNHLTIGKYLIRRIEQSGVKHLFGVPGDYVLDLLDDVLRSSLQWIGNCNELNAGYAADGYARMNGLSAVIVTYGVGGLSVINAVAGAYAEQVPMIVISGAPPTLRRKTGAMVHHLIGDYTLQFDIFRKVTADAAILDDPEAAPDAIDRVVANCIALKRPVYLELPMDMINAQCREPGELKSPAPRKSDAHALSQCVAAAAEMINKSERPVLLAGVELARFDLAAEALKLVEQIELPFATTVSSKSVLPELHPQFVGLYQGALSRPHVREQVEKSDCVLALGMWMTDFDTGGFSSKLIEENMIAANMEHVHVRSQAFDEVRLPDFLAALADVVKPRSFLSSRPAAPMRAKTQFLPQPEVRLTVKRFYERLNTFLDDDMILLTEPGDAVCGAPDLDVEEPENFIAQAYYLSIGYCTPAALGVSLARPSKRAVVLAGDGAFQMTAQELSTLIRAKCPAVIFLINNGGYVIERKLHEDGMYNDIQNWRYHLLPSAFSEDAIGLPVVTEGDLEAALETISREREKLVFVELQFVPGDCSAALEALGEKFKAASAKK